MVSYKNRLYALSVILLLFIAILTCGVYSTIQHYWTDMGVALFFAVLGSIFLALVGLFIYNLVMYFKIEHISLPFTPVYMAEEY